MAEERSGLCKIYSAGLSSSHAGVIITFGIPIPVTQNLQNSADYYEDMERKSWPRKAGRYAFPGGDGLKADLEKF